MTKICYKSIFPTSKVKGQLRAEENLGRIYTTAVDLVGASSAVFLKKIIQNACDESAKLSNQAPGDLIITKEKLEVLLEKEEYSFLQVVIDPSALPKYGKKKYKHAKKKGQEAPQRKMKAIEKGGENFIDMLSGSTGKNSKDIAVNPGKELSLDNLVTKCDHIDGIIEDDEDYD